MKKQHLTKFLVVGIALTLLLATAIPAMGAPDKVRVFVEFAPGAKGKVQEVLSATGAQFHYSFDKLNSFVVTIPSQSLNSLSRNPNVVEIEEDAPRYPIKSTSSKAVLAPQADTTDPNGQTIPWGIDAVQARDVWDTNRDGSFDSGATTGSGMTVCIIDTGYYSAHEDLAAVDLVGGMSQVDDNYARDGYGHGTHVAGTIAGQNNSFGVVGVSPSVSLYIIKYFDDAGNATFASDLIAATNTCAANGAQIISMSLGGSRSSVPERRNFDDLYAAGVLSIAAAGNDGNTALSYPASYNSVVSVAALDEALAIADFSQQNTQVEIAAPGVAVLSTLPYVDFTNMTVDGTDYSSNHIEYSARGTASGALVDGGLCDSVGSWSGAVVLCERGAISFYDKVINVQNGGGAAAVIYNNEPGNFFGTLGDGASSAIIGLSLSQEDGQYLVANKLGSTAYVSSEYSWPASGYEAWNGTSMATPHVSAVAALLWSANPSATNADIRDAMNATAFDLGAAGRDVAFGYGLVQAADALDYLGGGTVNTPPSVTITSPANGTSVEDGTPITFAGTATDAEDGDLSGAIAWSSSIDGALGTGASISATLSVGTHTITASATDSGSLTGTDSITVTVTGGGTGGDLHVSVDTDKDVYGDRQRVYITVTVTDGSAPVANASVTTTITTASGNVKQYAGTTDASGVALFSAYKTFIRKDGAGTHTVDATATLAGYTDGSGSTTFLVQ